MSEHPKLVRLEQLLQQTESQCRRAQAEREQAYRDRDAAARETARLLAERDAGVEKIADLEGTQQRQADVIYEMQRCRMIVQPHGPDTGCDHLWFAVSENEAEGEGQTVFEAVVACAKAHDKRASHTSGEK